MRLQVWIAVALLLSPPAALLSMSMHAAGGLSGTVDDAGGPVAGARVRYQAESRFSVTDPQGRFRLAASTSRSPRVTAWKNGYLIAAAPANLSPLLLHLDKVPREDNADYEWVDPRPDPAAKMNCGNCHQEIYREWSTEGHARSAVNRHLLNLYDGGDWSGRRGHGWNLLADRPEAAGVCNACHAPTASFNADLGDLHGSAAQGVHCDYCHKVVGADVKRVGLTHGRYGLDVRRPKKGQLFFGPLDDVDRHEDSYVPLYQESRYCAACHEGTVLGVTVYSTYSEWLASPARREGKQCQSCHMAPTGKLSNIAPGQGGVERSPATLANHRFFAGSPRDMLRAALRLTATLRSAGSSTRAEVQLLADAVGHRLPTGFIDRNLVLVVRGEDQRGHEVAALSGPRLPDLSGPGVSGQIGRLYARVCRDQTGRSPVPFWRAEPAPEDTRLIPGHADRLTVTFPRETSAVRVQVLYRRFWPSVAADKGWPDNEQKVIDAVCRRTP
jgi:hypothetical protein